MRSAEGLAVVQEAFPTQGAPTGHSQMSVLLGRRTTAEQAHAGHLALRALRVPGTGAQAGRGLPRRGAG